MNLALRCRPFLALVCCLVSLQSSYSQTQTSPKRVLATVSGRVTIKGKAAAGAAIGLRKMESNSILEIVARGVTDQDGNYRITNVPEGSYDVSVVAPAYVVAEQQSPRKMILVSESENIDGVNFSLVRGGVITGKVTDADGRPVIQQQVNAYRAEAWEQAAATQGRQPVFPTNTVSTDDRGIYRMFGLVAGRYKVGVGRADDSFSSPQPAGRATYQRVFHPDITEPAKATIIEVSEGSEAANIDISLGQLLETYSVSGRIIDGEKGLPVPGLRLGLERISNERFQSFSNFATANVQGEFTIDNVAPGKYHATLMSERGMELFMERVPFEVTDRDVTGMVLKLAKGASISGFVTLESEDPKALAKLRQAELRIFVSPATTGFGGRTASSTIGPDGSFRAAGLPAGVVSAFLSGGQLQPGPGPLKGFSVARIERDGITQTPRGFEIKDGEQVTGVRIVLIYGDGVIRGRIDVQNGNLPDARFSVRLSRTGDIAGQGAFTQVDARGHFMMDGLPSGIYELFVSVAASDRRVRRQIRQQVSVTSGSTTEVTVTVDASEPKSPQP